MILDNLSRAFKTQNWLAAGVEFVIVIAGVVIGFQINAWNEARAERAQGAANLALLVGEIQWHRSNADLIYEAALVSLQAVRTVERGINDPDYARNNPSEFLRAVFESRYGSYRAFSRTIYDGMESSGEIALIDDFEALSLIRRHYGALADTDSIYAGAAYNPREPYDAAVAGSVSLDLLVGTLDEADQAFFVELYGAEPLEPTPQRAEDVALRLGADPQVRKWLPEWEIYHAGVRQSAFEKREAIDDLLVRLGESQQEAVRP